MIFLHLSANSSSVSESGGGGWLNLDASSSWSIPSSSEESALLAAGPNAGCLVVELCGCAGYSMNKLYSVR